MSALSQAAGLALAEPSEPATPVAGRPTIPFLEGRVTRYLRGAVLDVKAPGERDQAPVVPDATVIRCAAPDAEALCSACASPAYDAIFARYLLDAAEAPGSLIATLFTLLRSNGHLVLQVRTTPPADTAAASPGCGEAPPARLWSWRSAEDLVPLIEKSLPRGAFQIIKRDPEQNSSGPAAPPPGQQTDPACITIVLCKLRDQATHRQEDAASVARATLMPSANPRVSFMLPSPAPPRAPQMTPDGALLVLDYRPMAVRRILVLKLDHHGDFIIGLPALRQLRAAFPGAHIRLVCGAWNLDTARKSGLADDVLGFNFFPERSAEWQGAPFADWHEFHRAAQGHFDLAIDLRVDEDTRYLLHHVNARLRCGIGSQARFPMLDVALPMGERDVIFPAFLEGTNSLVSPDGARDFGPDCFESRMQTQTPSFHETKLRAAAGWLLRSERFRLVPGRYEARFGLVPRRFLPASGAFGIKAEILLGAHPGADPDAGGFVQVAEAVIGRRALLLERVSSVTLGFEVKTDGATALLQVSAEGTAFAGRLRFTGVRLRRLDTGGARFRPSELHVGEKLSLLVNLIRQRVMPGEAPIGATGNTLPALREVGAPVREIVLAPFSNSEIRDWPETHYAELIRLLVRDYGCHVRLVGTPAQRPMADRLCSLAAVEACRAQVIDDVGRTSWADLSGILRGADLVICNNSGIAHRAAEEGCRTLAIYSASHQPAEWGPRGLRSRAIMLGIRCSPCGFERLQECPNDHACMRMLTPAMVMPHVKDLLRRV